MHNVLLDLNGAQEMPLQVVSTRKKEDFVASYCFFCQLFKSVAFLCMYSRLVQRVAVYVQCPSSVEASRLRGWLQYVHIYLHTRYLFALSSMFARRNERHTQCQCSNMIVCG